jgi:hypothetical protein
MFKKTNELLAINEINETLSINGLIDPSTPSVNEYFNSIHEIYTKSVTNHTHTKIIKLPSNDKNLPSWANDKYISMLTSIHNIEDKIAKRRNNNQCVEILESKVLDLDRIRHEYGQIIAKKYYKRLQLKDLHFAWKIVNELTGKTKEKT